jgi:hypothetical protein
MIDKDRMAAEVLREHDRITLFGECPEQTVEMEVVVCAHGNAKGPAPTTSPFATRASRAATYIDRANRRFVERDLKGVGRVILLGVRLSALPWSCIFPTMSTGHGAGRGVELTRQKWPL